MVCSPLLHLRSSWKVHCANFCFTEFSEDEMRRPTLNAVPYGLQKHYTGSNAQEGRLALEMDGSSEQPKTTAGLDIGDKYSCLCLIDTVSGEVIEEGRLRTIPEAFERPIPNHSPSSVAESHSSPL
jgi:hypothetical protein